MCLQVGHDDMLPLMWTGPVVAAFVVSVVAICASICSLVWQTYSWWAAGPRVRLSQNLGHYSEVGHPEEYLAIYAVNVGRLTSFVDLFAFGDGNISISVHHFSDGVPMSPEPVKLEPGEQTYRLIKIKHIARFCLDNSLNPADLVAEARVRGKTIRAKKAIEDRPADRVRHAMKQIQKDEV